MSPIESHVVNLGAHDSFRADNETGSSDLERFDKYYVLYYKLQIEIVLCVEKSRDDRTSTARVLAIAGLLAENSNFLWDIRPHICLDQPQTSSNGGATPQRREDG